MAVFKAALQQFGGDKMMRLHLCRVFGVSSIQPSVQVRELIVG
jgi:hypothetical protein